MMVEGWDPERRHKVSGWVREQTIRGEYPKLHADTLERVARLPRPSFVELADRVLLYALRLEARRGARINFRHPVFQAVAYTTDDRELDQFLDYFLERGFIKPERPGVFKFGPAGYIHCEQLQARQAASAQGFVAMWFDSSMKEAWTHGFEPAILAAGYDPVRVDGIEHTDKIDDRIIAEIRRSRFVVADFTEHRGGVYFEAGFALGLNLPVIWSCHGSHIEKLHFDIRQYNTIPWRDPADLATRLQRRIEAVVGDGPRKVARGTHQR